MSVSEIDDADVKSLITSVFATNDDEDLEEFKKYAAQKKTNIDSWEKVALNNVNNKALLHMEVELTVNELDRFVKDVEDHAKMRRYKKRSYSAGDWLVFRRKERNFIEKLDLGKVIMNKMIEAISSEPDPILDESLEDMLSMSQKLGYIRQEIDPMRQLAVIGTHLMERFARILEREGVEHDFPVPKKEAKKRYFRRLIKDEVYTRQDVSEALPESSPTTTQEVTTFETVSHPMNDEMFQSPASFIKEYAKRGGLLLEYKEISEVKNPWITQYIYTCTLDQITAEGKGRRRSSAKQDAAAHVIRIMLNKIRRKALYSSMPMLSKQEQELGLMLSCETVEYGNELQSICSSENARPPCYIPLLQSTGNAIRCKALGFNGIGYGRTKEIACRMAAKLVIDQIRDSQERHYISKYNYY